jgi:hypothetical protein
MPSSHHLEIISDVEINDKKLEMINILNEYYDNWVNAEYNELTFVEMQHKLMHALYYIKESFENSTGLIQLCKTHPCILLKCADINSDNPDAKVSLTLQEMFLNIISNYGEQYTQEDFIGSLGAPLTTIIENTNKIDNIVRELYQYRDLQCIFDIHDDDEQDARASNSTPFVYHLTPPINT